MTETTPTTENIAAPPPASLDSAATTPGAALASPPAAGITAGLDITAALADLKRAEAALASEPQQAQAAESSQPSSGITAFAVVGMPVQFMPRAIKGDDAPKLMAAQIVDVGEKGVVSLRVFPRTHAPSYVEHDVPPYAAENQDAGGFYWHLIGHLED